MSRLVLASLALTACAAACSEPERRPDVVLVVLDTLRPDRLELYGSERTTAPYLARVADEGAVFRNGFSSSSWTPPATASIATGLYPNSHGVVYGFMTNKRLERALQARGTVEVELARLPEEQPTLAERFQAAGYATYAVTTNVNIRRDLGFARGFDEFVHEHDADARRTADIVRGFEFPTDRPTFLYLHLNDPHKPFHARSPWYESYCAEDGAEPRGDDDEPTPEDTVRRYDSEISFADDALGIILAAHFMIHRVQFSGFTGVKPMVLSLMKRHDYVLKY